MEDFFPQSADEDNKDGDDGDLFSNGREYSSGGDDADYGGEYEANEDRDFGGFDGDEDGIDIGVDADGGLLSSSSSPQKTLGQRARTAAGDGEEEEEGENEEREDEEDDDDMIML